MTQSKSSFKVIVVGAGPSGLLLGLLLSKHGISVTILDAAEGLDHRPRATHYGPPAVHELRRAGVIDDVLAEGFIARKICWRKLDGTYLTGLDNDVLGDHADRVVCLPLDKLGKVLARHLQQQPTAEVKWNHSVTGIGQSDDKAWVDVSTADGDIKMEADYIVGCDGANSQIRRSLHGDWNFPGKTWNQHIVATNVYYDFGKYGYEDANFIIDPEHWHMASRISKDGMWRVSYGEKGGFSQEELAARQPMKFEKMLPGNPKPEQYKLANFSPYRVHQRLAERMRVGRFLLAADAAHLCNPFGGLGLTGGIVDVGGLSDCLYGIWSGQAEPDILDIYDTVRRQKYRDMVDPISSENLLRMFSDPETCLEPGKDEFLTLCLKAEKDVEFAREMALGINALQYDFTKHYKKVE
ncbi:FAD/NAD(P)-binding domain-containing protein [Coniochaeta ligniaria NRRL 30616]|uniref:FAD/NAD(P)-binding domain-containing protein n=1 Tax=Coniochaeta ligniaria NRRL 30616 TaxID=1408157 RepID=A0A1J7J6C6_9PEZI|nr:FAD/NAD(P)-binding domain-containing protein [Coniochaeta ligniaria NRRL 30616]